MVPGPGSGYASTAEMKPAESMPWAIRPPNIVVLSIPHQGVLVDVGRNAGKQDDVGFCDGFGNAGRHAGLGVGQCIRHCCSPHGFY